MTYDILFYYTLETMFLTLIKGFSFSEVFFISCVDLIFITLLTFPINYLMKKVTILNKLRIGVLSFLVYFFAFMYINNFYVLCVMVVFKALGNQLVSINSTSLLYSICKGDSENEVSRIEGKASAMWWILEAISAIVAGYLFELNPYISYYISALLLLVGFMVTFFIKLNKEDNLLSLNKQDCSEQINYEKNQNIALLKKMAIAITFLAFSFWGAAEVFGSSAKSLIQDIGATSVIIGWVYFGIKLLTSTVNVASYRIERKLKWKFLPISISLFFLSIFTMIFVYFINLSFIVKLIIMIFAIALMYITRNPYRLNIKNAMTNIYSSSQLEKVYSCYFVAENLGGAIFLLIASLVTNHLGLGFSIVVNLSIILFG